MASPLGAVSKVWGDGESPPLPLTHAPDPQGPALYHVADTNLELVCSLWYDGNLGAIVKISFIKRD